VLSGDNYLPACLAGPSAPLLQSTFEIQHGMNVAVVACFDDDDVDFISI